MIVLHENSHGIKIIREDKVRRSTVKIIGMDGSAICTYRFNNIPFYSHPLLSWANLDCCGGWTGDEQYLYTAVQEGKKPVAAISAQTLPDISPGSDYDVWYDPKPTRNGPVAWHHMIVARNGALQDYFDIDEIIAAYARQDVDVYRPDLEESFSVPLTILFRQEFWKAPQIQADWITTGLGLGYPIESTASILNGWMK